MTTRTSVCFFHSELKPMCMGAYVEFIGIYQVALGSEWEEKLYVMSDLQVGKGTQGHHMAITG